MKNTLYIICLVLLNYGCASDSPGSDDPETVNEPSMVNLVFPFENSLCNEGTNVTATMSTVLFEWRASANTNSYRVVVENLSSGAITTQQTTNTEIPITIQRATQFRWYVISSTSISAETAQSATWVFYNAGDGIQSYAPFPAEIISPLFADELDPGLTEISLDWQGDDLDDDIVGYDVYFGTTTSPEIYLSNIGESQVNNVPIEANTIYYWKVITKDSQGNTSDSGLYQFKNP